MKNVLCSFAFVLAFVHGNFFNMIAPKAEFVAQVDYFLKIEGVAGESTDHEHEGWIDLLSVTPIKKRPGNRGYAPIQATKKQDRSSPKLAQYAAKGIHIKEVILHVRDKNARGGYLRYKLKDVLVSSYQTSGSSGGDVIPTDSFSLNFSKIEF